MALTKRGKWHYGESAADLRTLLIQVGKANGYEAHHFAEPVCSCGSTVFKLFLDDESGCAVRVCAACDDEHPVGDSADFLDEAELEQAQCPCEQEVFELCVAVSLYEDSDDVRWLYLGCRCPACGVTELYGDWKNEFEGYRELLARV